MSNPGWYQDPSNSNGLRFYDGVKWTDHVAVSSQISEDKITDFLLPSRKSQTAIIAGYLGLFSLSIWPLGFLALFFSIKALPKPKFGSDKLRIATGFILGGLGSILSIAALVLLLLS